MFVVFAAWEINFHAITSGLYHWAKFAGMYIHNNIWPNPLYPVSGNCNGGELFALLSPAATGKEATDDSPTGRERERSSKSSGKVVRVATELSLTGGVILAPVARDWLRGLERKLSVS